ncbi:capsular polysaccharide biosynthesis protein [Thalassobacillus devorans]|uniref:Capsular polysaccharide biosynthesis protein n=1 Tax=Thalassobacillus devorans TaxID=279813 RepID=A0ABQ1NNT1_9BACI|nr:CapA family protein [Thalassobacillus devorans]NIK27640.1 poly-gamma-glutamate synthesis protein (capsule biosynthesis protein) [Thalassobacillus devorans]GGC79344.1 capsular polysaccharide biosynthesis protein [Thalassobacillus devorans]
MKYIVTILVFSLIFIVGCSSAEEKETSRHVSAEGGPLAEEKGAPSPEGKEAKGTEAEELPDPEPEPSSMTLTFTGDVLFAMSLEQTVAEKGHAYPFQHVSDYFLSDDFTFINLETAVTERGTKEDKLYNFRTRPEAMSTMKQIGVDGVALANNHTLDYGIDGLVDTLHFAEEAGLETIGAGRTENEAYQAFETEIQGKRVAFLNFSKVLPFIEWYAVGERPGAASGYQMERVINIIQATKEKNDYVFVQIHWGNEKEIQFNESEQLYAHAMIDAGADGIIGSHPHVLQGFEMYKGKLIAYSLGNFLFPDYVAGETAQTGILQVEIDENEAATYSFHPHFIEDDLIKPHPDRNSLARALEQRSAPGITINDSFEITGE